MRKNIKKLLFTLLFAATLLSSTSSCYKAATNTFNEVTTVPPLSIDENLPDFPYPF